MPEEHLAIASVPKQTWGAVYDDREALRVGTIFKDLDKPFFAAETLRDTGNANDMLKPGKQLEREKLLTRILEVSFALDDLTLYLDTHEKDADANKMFLEKTKEREQLKKQFAMEFYPLTRDCVVYGKEDGSFLHVEGPCPWEGVCV